MRTVVVLVGAVLVASLNAAAAGPADGGRFNKKLAIGDAAPAWGPLDAADGKKYALADFAATPVLVLAFTCNSCPVAVAYEPRLRAVAEEFAGKPDSKVAVVAVNVNTGPADALPAMKARHEKQQVPYPYLYDPSQDIARAHGAMYTPEFVVFDATRKVVYTGAMDDKAPPGVPKTDYLVPAIKAALAGTPAAVGESSAAAGCRIKWLPAGKK